MKKVIKFSLVTLWIVLTRAYDAYSTYQYTPDLSQEANPLSSVLGLSWVPLLSIISLLLIYCIYAYYQSEFKSFNFLPSESGYTLSELSTYLYLGKKAHWTSIFYSLPNEGKRFNHYMGTLMPPCLVFAGVVSTIMWLLINYTDWYLAYHSATAIYLILILGGIAIVGRWNWKMYHQYQTRLRN